MSDGTFVYSVLRAVPRPRRGERINIGVVVVAADGTFSDVRVDDLDRVRRLDKKADLRSIELFVESLRARRPLGGSQRFLVPGSSQPMTADVLMDWSREFGGAVQVGEPRAALAQDGDRLLRSLYREYVAPLPAVDAVGVVRIPRTQMLPQLLSTLDRNSRLWNIADEAIEESPTIHGRRAQHVVDRAYFGPRRRLQAVVHAISFQARELAEVYANRATIIVAAEDLHDKKETEDLPVFALESDAPIERLEAMQESGRLFKAREVVPVRLADLDALRGVVDSRLVVN